MAGNKVRDKVGNLPGTLVYTGDEMVSKTKFTLIKYDPDGYSIDEYEVIEDALKGFDTKKVNWLKVEGLNDIDQIKRLGDKLNIHPLILEDILNVKQLPKLEVHDEYLFMTLKRIISSSDNDEVEMKHISLLLGNDYVISFQDYVQNSFKSISERIASQHTKVKQRKADYLFYYLLDLIVDEYYLVFEKANVQVEEFEISVLEDTTSETVTNIIQYKKKISGIRKFIYALDEALNILFKSETTLIDEYNVRYFNDVNDHLKGYMENIKSNQDRLASLIDLNLSVLSTKMNKVMYILTIVMTIFVPLTFLAGIYGMNFTYMPELEYKYSYFIILGVMFFLGVGILLYMKRKNWL